MPDLFRAARSAVLGLSLLACSPAAHTIPQAPATHLEPRRYFSLDGFTLVDTVPAEDSVALEEILGLKDTETNTKILEDVITVDPEDEALLQVAIFASEVQPEIMYYIDLTSSEPRLRSMGSSFLLHKNGFFLTAYHVFDDHLTDQEKGRSSMMLMYDPMHGFAATAQPLIFSKQYDILLGKVDIAAFPIATTVISPEPKPILEYAYSYTFNNTDYFISGLFEAVMRSGKVNSDCTFTQHTLLEDDLSRYSPFISIGALVTTTRDGKEIKNDGLYAFIVKMVPGNSGAAVFDIVNRQTGVVTTAINSVNPDIPNVTVYTGPEKIREMLTVYLSAVGRE